MFFNASVTAYAPDFNGFSSLEYPHPNSINLISTTHMENIKNIYGYKSIRLDV
jgi:hypothetical protein